MVIGVPRERKIQEYRVAVTPLSVSALVQSGHKVFIEKGAGVGSGITDADFRKSGAKIVGTEEELFDKCSLIVKVKEPLTEEYPLIKEHHTLFCYLHLAADRKLVRALKNSGCRAIAFETVELPDGSLPLLVPMSRIAGRLSVQVGVHFLQKSKGGKGVLLSGAPGVRNGKVVIIGGGTVGYNALESALGLGADVVVIDISHERLEYYYEKYQGKVKTVLSVRDNIERELLDADLVVGAVLVTGLKAPKIVTRNMISKMEPGSLFVDVAIDQGGCSETSKPTSHDSPVYDVRGIKHYCVTNIPSLVSKTSTYSLANSILPYILKIANQESDTDVPLKKGINIDTGKLLINLS